MELKNGDILPVTKSFWQQAACLSFHRLYGRRLPVAGDLGHTIVHQTPGSLESAEDWLALAQGLSLKNISIKVLKKEGRKIFEDFGEMVLPTTVLRGRSFFPPVPI